MKVIPVLLAGGAGERLWPLSDHRLPKQFAALFGSSSTYQQTLRRIKDPELFLSPIVLTARDWQPIARDQARAIGVEPLLLLEPVRRNTAAAIAAASLFIAQNVKEALVLILACDHVIEQEEEFRLAVKCGIAAAQAGEIVLFGIRPQAAEARYGYVLPGNALAHSPGTWRVSEFIEKPAASEALRYVDSGYLWNSGNFLVRTDVILEALYVHAPEVIGPMTEAGLSFFEEQNSYALDPSLFNKVPSLSIDRAVIERAKNRAVVKSTFSWMDIGVFEALWRASEKDAFGNAVHGFAEMRDASGCLVYADGIAATVVGIDNLLVIARNGHVWVAPRAKMEDISKLSQETGKS